jgi:hypothetical protein
MGTGHLYLIPDDFRWQDPLHSMPLPDTVQPFIFMNNLLEYKRIHRYLKIISDRLQTDYRDFEPYEKWQDDFHQKIWRLQNRTRRAHPPIHLQMKNLKCKKGGNSLQVCFL